MEYRRLGKTGLQVSALSLGSWLTFGSQITDDVAEQLMIKAYDSGVNFFDNAETYAHGQSEVVMGKLLKKLNWDRDTWLVSSKVFWPRPVDPKPNQKGLMRKHLFEGCHSALKRLQVEYIDLFYCHRPDVNTPVEEVVWTMHQLYMQGKILYWGTSEWSGQQITEAHYWAAKHGLIAPVMEQPQYNMLTRDKVEKDYLPLYETFGLGTTTWSPLASGFLTGKHLEGVTDDKSRMAKMASIKDRTVGDPVRMEKLKKLIAVANGLGIPMAHLALCWCLKNKHVSSVILGASKVAQLEENLKCLDSLPKVTDEVMARIETILQNKPDIITY